MVNISYAAMLPELAGDYHERTILTGYRMRFAVLGTFMGAVMLISTMAIVFTIHEPKRTKERVHAGFFSTFTGVREFVHSKRRKLQNDIFLRT